MRKRATADGGRRMGDGEWRFSCERWLPARCSCLLCGRLRQQRRRLRRLPLAVALDGVPHPLPLRFLLREEEARSGDLLRTWLDLAARPRGMPAGVAAFELPRCGEPGSPLLA